jgi:glycosyltransferase involved in cell wall biosynthesis
MRVLVLTPSLYDSAPGPRFRIEQWARYLQHDGFQFTFLAFESPTLHRLLYTQGHFAKKVTLTLAALLRRLHAVKLAAAFDVIFLYREAALLGPAWIERLMERSGVPIVYDFDDPIWLAYKSPSNPLFGRMKFHTKTASICRLARSVMVGNKLLAEYAHQHGKHVDIVPSTIDMANCSVRRPSSDSTVPVTLGWTGSHSTLPFLEQIANVLRKLAQERHFRLVVVSHTDKYRLAGLPMETVARKWSAGTEAEDLADVDIGLAPFPNTGWTPWRCHGKVLQYMAGGMATVASNIGILPDYIKDGVEGYLVGSEQEWLARLKTLIDDAVLRRRFGKAARSKVEESYSAQVWAPRVGEILRSAVALGPAA